MKNKKSIIAVAVLLVLVIGAFLAYTLFRPAPLEGEKTVSVTVVHSDGSEKLFELRTDSASLGDVLKAEGIITGTEGPYGMYILTVDSETVDEAQQQWWCITKGGAEVVNGVDELMIADGDRYEITFKTGW